MTAGHRAVGVVDIELAEEQAACVPWRKVWVPGEMASGHLCRVARIAQQDSRKGILRCKSLPSKQEQGDLAERRVLRHQCSWT